MECRTKVDVDGAGVLSFEGGAWRLVRYRDLDWGAIPICQKLPIGSGPDVVVCELENNSYGWYSSALFTLDYQRADGDEEVELVRVVDTTWRACGGSKEVVIATLHSVKLVDLDNDGTLDLTALLGAMRARIPPQPPCAEPGQGFGDPPKNLPSPPLKKLEFNTKGRSLVPAPATARAIAKLPKS